MSQGNNVSGRIQSFILEKFPLARKRSLGSTDNLLENGILDSLGVLDVVGFIEKEFALAISDEELASENFSSIEQIAAFIETKNRAHAGDVQ